MNPVAPGLGFLAGLGLALVANGLPLLRRPRLEQRLEPYLRDTQPPALRTLDDAGGPFPTVQHLLAPILANVARFLDRVLGGTATLRARLDAAGRSVSVEEYRIEQVVWAAAGLLGGIALSLLFLLHDPKRSPWPLVLLCGIAIVGGAAARDVTLSREAHRRRRRILAEFPTIAELLALAIGAGEGPAQAFDRISKSCRGELATEIARMLAEARSGVSFVTALENLAGRVQVPIAGRFVDGVVVALQRGTPLADVLRAQAADVREAAKRELLEIGGRKEIAMMVPVVFLILPVTMLFALFPSFVSLQLLT
ncbi:MAG: type II secretion system F family protein [Acidothermus sp.]|nr:type II secretion system F family protein [Acidothermus sp.]